MLFKQIEQHCDELVAKFDTISTERKALLSSISKYIESKRAHNQSVNLVYVCTHNSRRSHFGQVWAAVAACYYNISDVTTFSGGTEATAFNPNAIKALMNSGFEVTSETVTVSDSAFRLLGQLDPLFASTTLTLYSPAGTRPCN